MVNDKKKKVPYDRQKQYPKQKRLQQKYRKKHKLDQNQVADHVVPLKEHWEIGLHPALYYYVPYTMYVFYDIGPGSLQTQEQRDHYIPELRTQSRHDSNIQGYQIAQLTQGPPGFVNEWDRWKDLKQNNHLFA